jgi:HPt (histidine-containing phosphotransfer) domain-containing protein
MTQDDINALPLLNPAALDRLRDELDDDDGVWGVFVRNFIAQLPQRTEKLRLALTTGDFAGSLDAVLSLKTSSQMVGAQRLAEFAIRLERSVRTETREAAPGTVLPRLAVAHLKTIVKCGQQTSDLLQRYLDSATGRK